MYFHDSTKKLTYTSLSELFASGGDAIHHSPEARELIAFFDRTFGIRLMACYLNCHAQADISKGPRLRRWDPDNIPFEGYLELSLYVLGPAQLTEDQKAAAVAALKDIFDRSGTALYERSYSEKEKEYYGWPSLRPDLWDESRAIPFRPPTRSREIVNVYSFDDLALEHMICAMAKDASHLPEIRRIGATPYMVLETESRPTCYLTFKHRADLPQTPEEQAGITAVLTDLLRRRDAFGVLDRRPFTPVFAAWDELSDEQRFGLARENNWG